MPLFNPVLPSYPPTKTTDAVNAPDNMQVLYSLLIDTDDYYYIDGDLVEMD